MGLLKAKQKTKFYRMTIFGSVLRDYSKVRTDSGRDTRSSGSRRTRLILSFALAMLQADELLILRQSDRTAEIDSKAKSAAGGFGGAN